MPEMHFKDRWEAGQLLAKQLDKYRGTPLVVYGLPRGGVVTAYAIAHYLKAPLDLVIVRKIGHPYEPEYALGAVAEDGHLLGDEEKLALVDQTWLTKEINHQRKEAGRRRTVYSKDRPVPPVVNATAILVDDGVATGYTLRLGIMELRHRRPKKIVVAVPVIPESVATLIKSEVDELVALEIPSEDEFFGSVGAYYEQFLPVEDEEVLDFLSRNST